MIDRYVADLRHRLRGPVIVRAGMVREVRDGLLDAAEAHRASGLDTASAERQAVDEFGSPDVIAAGLRPELAAAAGRHLAVLMLLLGSVQFVVVEALWKGQAADDGWPPVSAGYGLLAQFVDVSNLVTLAGSALAALALGIGGRVLPSRPIVRAASVLVLADLLIAAVGGPLLTAFAPVPVTTWPVGDLVQGAIVTLVPSVWMAALAWRCLQLTSGRGLGPEDGAHDAAERAEGLAVSG